MRLILLTRLFALAAFLSAPLVFAQFCPSEDGRLAIARKWLDNMSDLGQPTTYLYGTLTPNQDGCYTHYTNNSSIYWSPTVGAHIVWGRIREKWSSLPPFGWERSFLGYPRTDESTAIDGIGRFSEFQNGSIYWTPETDAHEIHGAIREKWAKLDWYGGLLGYPVTDETVASDGIGRYNNFQNGSIYFHPYYGTFEIHGPIHSRWVNEGSERGFLGYPRSDVIATENGKGKYGEYSEFKWGRIYNNSGQAYRVVHPILSPYLAAGAEKSKWGFPVGDTQCPSFCFQNFEGGWFGLHH